MITARTAMMAAALLAAMAASQAAAQEHRVLRYGDTSGWFYDDRDDDRDQPNNSFFPGNFASDPTQAWHGAAGPLEINPRRSPAPYPSQVVFGPATNQPSCNRRHRASDAASGSFLGKDGPRHRCR
jgi:hypothetical protein